MTPESAGAHIGISALVVAAMTGAFKLASRFIKPKTEHEMAAIAVDAAKLKALYERVDRLDNTVARQDHEMDAMRAKISEHSKANYRLQAAINRHISQSPQCAPMFIDDAGGTQ